MTQVFHQRALQHPGQDHPGRNTVGKQRCRRTGPPWHQVLEIEHADTGDDADKDGIEQL
ncbi:hypothetical protein D3C76_1855140 [compost metagenome]